MLILLAAVLAAMGLVMTTGWVVQERVGNGGWSDVFWTFGAGLACAVCALVPLSAFPAAQPFRQYLVAALVAVWCVRLGTYVARRVIHGAEDVRYTELREAVDDRFPQAMFALMIIQAPATLLLAVSVILAAHAPGTGPGLRDVIATAILAIAILGEGLADAQLARFKAQKHPKGAINDQGLWGWSRHPNYFFEWVGWLAYPVLASSYGLGSPWFWLSFCAAGLMYVLLNFVSGVPPLERSMLASRGEPFRAYQARTSSFFLLPPKRKATP
jgi:steroid 5-alpha reductase family enzyme